MTGAEDEQPRNIRSKTQKEMQEGGRMKQAERRLVREAGKIWNQAPRDIKEAKNMEAAKVLFQQYCKTLQI